MFPKATTWLSQLRVSHHEDEIEPSIGFLGTVYFLIKFETQFPNFDLPGYLQKVYVKSLLFKEPFKLISYFYKALKDSLVSWGKWALVPIREFIRWGRFRLNFMKQLFSDLMKSRNNQSSISGFKDLLDEIKLELQHILSILNWRKKANKERRDAYARLTGLPEDCVKELDETPWVIRWRLPASNIAFLILTKILPLALVILLFSIIAFGIFEHYNEENITFIKIILRQQWLPNFMKNVFNQPEEKEIVWEIITKKMLLKFAIGFLGYWLLKVVIGYLGFGEDYLRKPAIKVAETLVKYGRDVPYIFFGHDHIRNVQRIKPDKNIRPPETRPWYMNTGTWMVKHEMGTKRLLREPHEYPFVRMIDTHRILASGADPNDYMIPRPETRPLVELLRWNDDVLKVETCETFMGTEEGKR
jgi:hypothetical protein